MLSPIYTTATRGGCWFCHNQGVNQLRLLRRNYPYLLALMLKWDADSPVSFKADGHTVHDYDERFRLEDEGLIPGNQPFRWSVLDETQLWCSGMQIARVSQSKILCLSSILVCRHTAKSSSRVCLVILGGKKRACG